MNYTKERSIHESPFRRVRKLVLERDGNQCVKCSSSIDLEVHHTEGYKRNEPEYLATLCFLCHLVAPMGQDRFAQWLLLGESGIDVLQRRLKKKGLKNLNSEKILAFCSTLAEMGFEFTVKRTRAAREHIRSSGERCEGRKPYGTRPGEPENIDFGILKWSTSAVCFGPPLA
jgi:hypothetical protein